MCVRARARAFARVMACLRVARSCEHPCALAHPLTHNHTLSLASRSLPSLPLAVPPQGIRRTDLYKDWHFPPMLELWRFVRKSLQSAEKQKAMLQRAILQMRVLTQVCSAGQRN